MVKNNFFNYLIYLKINLNALKINNVYYNKHPIEKLILYTS
jgi:hypothetical protein